MSGRSPGSGPQSRRAGKCPGAQRLGPLLCGSVALVSAALIAYEIVLMRRMVLERWHHFGFLIISLALLGFGASGTLLAVLERSVRRRPATWMYVLALGLFASLLVLPRVAAVLPVSVRFIPHDDWEQVGWWSLYALCALGPFLIGGALLGIPMMTAGQWVGRVYAANLVGSAAGALGGVLVLSHYSIEAGLWPSLALTALAVAGIGLITTPEPFADRAARGPGGRYSGAPGRAARPALPCTVLLAAIVIGVTVEWRWPLGPAYDEHKYGAYLARMVAQGSARRLAAAADPYGFVELYESPLFHDLPFVALGPGAPQPPPMLSVVINGDAAGSVLRIDSADQAGVMDRTLMAIPYRLIAAGVASQPRVLLLGEVGGSNVWLARRDRARHVTVVQPNDTLLALLRNHAPTLLSGDDVSVYAGEPGRFLDSAQVGTDFDLIQIAALEGLGVGGAGTRGLAEDHLATVERFADCLRRLRPGGVLAVCRGVQFPERENIRLFATMAEALESNGVADPASHLVQVRDYLGVCTMALASPLADAQRDGLREALRDANLTAVWFDGIRDDEVNQPDALPGPPGERADWLHHAAREIVGGAERTPTANPGASRRAGIGTPDAADRHSRREAFYASWMLNVRPAHDDRPFFWDFFKPQAVVELRAVYRDLWLTRAELGRLFLFASLLLAGVAAIGLILAPLGVSRVAQRWRQHNTSAPMSDAASDRKIAAQAAPRGVTVAALIYFGGIGLGFMGIEMALISRATAMLGDPVLASALVIGAVLLLSGLGSATAIRGAVNQTDASPLESVRQLARTWSAPLLVAGGAGLICLVAYVPAGGGATITLVIGVPLAFVMGRPMPIGLSRLDRLSPRLIPWAWGINGVGSVIGASAAIAIAMAWGYRTVFIAAAVCYFAAAAPGALLARPARAEQARSSTPAPDSLGRQANGE